MNGSPQNNIPSTFSPKLPSLPAKPQSSHWLMWTLITIALLIIVYAAVVRPLLRAPVQTGKYGAGNRPVTVVVESARLSDLNLRLVSLGTVTPVSTATVRSRVDGQLQHIYFEEGRLIEAGAPFVDLDPRPFLALKQQAEAQLAKDTALLDNAKIDEARYETLLEQDSIAKQQLDTQHALVKQYEASIKVDQAQVDSASLQLTYAHVTAPISGRVGLRQVDLGNIIHASDASGIAVITQLRPITIVFSIPQDALPKVLKHFRQNEVMKVEAFDRDGKLLLATGKLVTIDNQIDPSTGTIKLRAEFPNADESLFPNQFVNIQLLAEQIQGATVVSVAAIQRGTIGTFVYVVSDKDGQKTASVRTVETGASEHGVVAITKGLTVGDIVVVDGMDKLREGSLVETIQKEEATAAPTPDAAPVQKKEWKHKRDAAAQPAQN